MSTATKQVNTINAILDLVKTNLAAKLGYLSNQQHDFVMDDLDDAITDALAANLEAALARSKILLGSAPVVAHTNPNVTGSRENRSKHQVPNEHTARTRTGAFDSLYANSQAMQQLTLLTALPTPAPEYKD